MRVEVIRVKVNGEVKEVRVRINGSEIVDSLYLNTEYEVLTGIPGIIVLGSEVSLARGVIGESVKEFGWGRYVKFKDMTDFEIQKELQRRRTDILNWNRNRKEEVTEFYLL